MPQYFRRQRSKSAAAHSLGSALVMIGQIASVGPAFFLRVVLRSSPI